MATEPQTRQILITRTSHRPSRADVRRLMARFGSGDVPDAAINQLIDAMPALNRWMTQHHEDAGRLMEDPAAVLEAMQQAGVLEKPVADLLTLLRSLRTDSEGKLTARARLVNFLRPSSAHFGRKPVLRVTREHDTVDGSDQGGDR
jgi:hypothetical protein